jgi:hypothetical protein
MGDIAAAAAIVRCPVLTGSTRGVSESTQRGARVRYWSLPEPLACELVHGPAVDHRQSVTSLPIETNRFGKVACLLHRCRPSHRYRR